MTLAEQASVAQGDRSFTDFMKKGDPAATWRVASVRGYPVNYFGAVQLELDAEELGETEDLTAGEFRERRVAFYRDRPQGWGVAPTHLGREWAGALQMATSLSEGWERGYQQAIAVLHGDDGLSRRDAAVARRTRAALEGSGDYQGVRISLDAAADSLYMSRPTAQFYLGMSPGSFKQALARGTHPFAPPKGGATKGEVDTWFRELVKAKHAAEIKNVHVLRVARDLSSGRPYFVDESGVILADGAITNISPQDVAYAASLGAGIRILSLGTALSMPWRSPIERKAWAGYRERLLERNMRKANSAIENARAEDLAASGRGGQASSG